MARRLAPILAACALAQEADARWGAAPDGWGDFRFALVDDNTQHRVIKDGMASGAQVYGRYRYLNAGVDSATNWYSYVGPHGAAVLQFERNSEDIGLSSSYVIYMLQEDGGFDTFIKNVQNPAYMKGFFWNLEWLARTLAGRKTVFVIEPDTWGYLLQHEQGRLGVQTASEYGKAVSAMQARVGDIGYPHLAGLPNTVAGMMQGIVKTFRTFAPDARIGFHLNTWAWIPPTGGDVRGMPYWPQNLVDASADINGFFLKNLFGQAAGQGGSDLGSSDLGDFLVVEKYGLDAGYIKSLDASSLGSRYYWNDDNMAKWVGWCKRVGKSVDMPILGWQIPIGHMALPNTANRWQDTFMEYFFAHPGDFIDAGFIGLWVGKGLSQGTDYSAVAGKGDDGRLFSELKKFDQKRPWLLPPNSSVSGRALAQLRPRTAMRRARGAMAFSKPSDRKFPGAPAPWRDAGGRALLLRQGTLP